MTSSTEAEQLGKTNAGSLIAFTPVSAIFLSLSLEIVRSVL